MVKHLLTLSFDKTQLCPCPYYTIPRPDHKIYVIPPMYIEKRKKKHTFQYGL